MQCVQFFSFVFLDAVLAHCCAVGLLAWVCFSSFINNFNTQLCFSTTSHSYGNLKSHWERRRSRGGIWLFLNISLRQRRAFDHTKTVCPPSQWSLSSPSIKRVRYTEREKKGKNYNLPTSRRQQHLTTYQLLVMQSLCAERPEQEEAQLPLALLSHLPVETLPRPPGLPWEFPTTLRTSLANTPAPHFLSIPAPPVGRFYK